MKPLADAGDRLAALTDFEHNLVITAGAGSGKTSLLTARVVCALLGQRLQSHQLLVTTFTEKAAGEMAERVEAALLALARDSVEADSAAGQAHAALQERFGLTPAQIGERARALDEQSLPVVETFHAFCLRTLGELAHEAGLPAEVRIAETIEIDELFDDWWNELLLGELGPTPTSALLDASQWRTLLSRPGLDGVRTAVRELCLHPHLADLPVDVSVEPLLQRAAALVARFDEILAEHDPPPTFRDVTLPAIEAARTLASGQPLGDVQRAATREFLRRSDVPQLSSRAPDDVRHEARHLQRSLRGVLELAFEVADPVETEALLRLCRGASRRFAEACAGRGLLTFADCLARCYRLLRDDVGVRRRLCDRFRQILVDEFQDTDPLQYDILFLLAQDGEMSDEDDPRRVRLAPGRLCIVGDPGQSIYRFRGADMEAFDRAVGQVLRCHGRRLHLSVNFRSRLEILSLVNLVVRPCIRAEPGVQPEFIDLVAGPDAEADGQPAGSFLLVMANGTVHARRAAEARALARLVRERVHAGDARFGDFAFLFRAFTDAELYARELRQLGVPVLVEGSTRFWVRHEVERFLSLLAAVARPWDEAAVLACLRGPLGAVPDVVLAAQAAAGVPPGRVLALADEALTALPRPLREAALRLRRIGEEARSLPPLDALLFLLHATPLAAIEAAGYDGAQRLANLEALVQRVARAPAARRRGLQGLADLLAAEAKRQVEAEESPLADAQADAVRLLTIHKAKGLEFADVVVPDLGRQSPGRESRDPLQILRSASGDRLLLDLPGMRSPRLFDAADRAGRHEAAEEARLIYVALTRARRRVWLSASQMPGRDAPWAPLCEALGIDAEHLPADGHLLRELLRFERLAATAEVTETAGAAPQAQQDLAAALARHASYLEQLPAVMRPRLAAPSALAAEAEAAPARRAAVTPSLALAIGSLVHDYLRAADFTRAGIDDGRLRALIAALGGADPDSAARLRSEARHLLQQFLDSPLRQRLARARVLGREVPVLCQIDGHRYHGSLDVVLDEDGEIVVGDFKTDRVEADGLPDLAARYAPQMRVYAQALQAAYELPQPPRAELFVLRLGRAVVVS